MTLSFAHSPRLLSLRNQTRRLDHRFHLIAGAIRARLSQNGLLPARLLRRIDAPAQPLPIPLHPKEAGQ